MSKRAAIYARVSTDEQAEQGYGLPYQLDRCQEHATRRGYAVVIDPITDDYTGKTAFRPGMSALLDQIAAHRIEVVIIHRTDRLGRRAAVQDLLEGEIEARGAAIEYVSATFDRTTAAGRAMRRVQGAFDQLDYENTIDRLKEHKLEAVKRGSIVVTRPPYGYSVVKQRNESGRRIAQLEIVEEEAQIVRQIFDWYVQGDGSGCPLSLYAITGRLTAQRIPTRGDTGGLRRTTRPAGVWSISVVRNILHSDTYIGRWHYQRTKRIPVPGTDKVKQERIPDPAAWVTISVPPIVSEDLAQAARARAAQNLAASKRNRRYDYLFSGMLRCEHCGVAYVGHDGRRGWPRYRCKYRCSGSVHACDMPDVTEAKLGPVAWDWISEIVSNPDAVDEALQQRQRLATEHNDSIRARLVGVERAINERQIEQARVFTLYKKGKLSEERWEMEDAACSRELSALNAERTRLEEQLTPSRYTPEYLADVQTACARIRAGLTAFTQAEQRKTYEILDFKAQLMVEDGLIIAYASCMLDARRLGVGETRVLTFASPE